MNKILVGLVALVVLAGALPGNASARHTLAHRVAALEGKVTKLQRDVRTLRNQNAALARELACIVGAAPVAQFLGYVYDPDGTGPMESGYTTALDVTAQGETPQAFLAMLDPACLGGRGDVRLFSWEPAIRDVRPH